MGKEAMFHILCECVLLPMQFIPNDVSLKVYDMPQRNTTLIDNTGDKNPVVDDETFAYTNGVTLTNRCSSCTFHASQYYAFQF